MTNSANTGTDNKLPSLDGLRGFFGSFEFAQAQETQNRIGETIDSTIESTEKYIAENSTDFIRVNLRDQAQCLKIIHGNEIRTYPYLKIDRTRIKSKSVPFVSDLYSSKSTITRVELESYLNSYVRGQRHLKDEQKLLLLVMILEYGDSELLKNYCRVKNTLGLLLIYPDFINEHQAREDIFKRWFAQIDAIHNEEYSFDRTSTWGKYLHDNFGEIQAVQSRLSKFSEKTEEAVDQTKSEVGESLNAAQVGMEVFKKYVTGKHLQEVAALIEQTKRMSSLSTEQILDYFSEEEYFRKLQIDSMHVVLNGKNPGNIGKITEMFTLLRYFNERGKTNKEQVKEKIKQYLVITLSRDTDISEIIFMSMLFASKGITFTEMNIKAEIRDIALFFPLFYPEFIKKYGENCCFFSWWFKELDGEMKKDIENPESDLWKYLLQNFGEIEVVKNEYEKINNRALEALRQKENIPILEDVEVEAIADFYGIPDVLLPKLKILSRNLKQLFDPRMQGPLATNPIASVYGNYKNITKISTGDKVDLGTTYMMWERLDKKTQESVIQQLNPHRSMDVIDRGMMALILIKPGIIDIPNAKRVAVASSASLLLYPHFLNSIPPGERDVFFTAFLDINRNRDEICDANSPIWNILLRYFGDNRVVKTNYTQVAKEHNKAELLGVIDLEVSLSGELKLGESPEIGEGKTLHVILFERSNGKRKRVSVEGYYREQDIRKGAISLNGPRYSYLAFSHRNDEAFTSKASLPEEVNFDDAIFLKREQKPDIGKDNNASGDTKTGEDDIRTDSGETETEAVEELFPDEIKVVTEEGIEFIDFLFDDPEVDGHQNYMRFTVTEYGVLEYQSQTFDPEKEISGSRIHNFQDLAEVEIRELLGKRREEKEKIIQAENNKRRGEEKLAQKKKMEIDRAERKIGREIFTKQQKFSKKIDTYINFFHATSPDERKTIVDEQEVFYWQISPKDVIVNSLETICSKSGFTLSLEYGRTGFLEFVTFNSEEYGAFEYTTDSFPFNKFDNNDNAIGREITRNLLEVVISVIFCENYVSAKK